MAKESKALAAYRDITSKIFHANMAAITKDQKWTFEERAGTATVVAVTCMSHAAFAVAAVTPHLKNAPMEAQIDDFLGLIREMMVEKHKGPQLSVVPKPEADNG